MFLYEKLQTVISDFLEKYFLKKTCYILARKNKNTCKTKINYKIGSYGFAKKNIKYIMVCLNLKKCKVLEKTDIMEFVVKY